MDLSQARYYIMHINPLMKEYATGGMGVGMRCARDALRERNARFAQEKDSEQTAAQRTKWKT